MVARLASATILAKDLSVLRMKNVSMSKKHLVQISSAHLCHCVSLIFLFFFSRSFDLKYNIHKIILGRPKMVYANPCATGTPLVDETGGNPIMCTQDAEDCPDSHDCVEIDGSSRAVCCPREPESIEGNYYE